MLRRELTSRLLPLSARSGHAWRVAWRAATRVMRSGQAAEDMHIARDHRVLPLQYP